MESRAIEGPVFGPRGTHKTLLTPDPRPALIPRADPRNLTAPPETDAIGISPIASSRRCKNDGFVANRVSNLPGRENRLSTHLVRIFRAVSSQNRGVARPKNAGLMGSGTGHLLKGHTNLFLTRRTSPFSGPIITNLSPISNRKVKNSNGFGPFCPIRRVDKFVELSPRDISCCPTVFRVA